VCFAPLFSSHDPVLFIHPLVSGKGGRKRTLNHIIWGQRYELLPQLQVAAFFSRHRFHNFFVDQHLPRVINTRVRNSMVFTSVGVILFDVVS